ncbi:MAG: hypothetical protein U0411_01820 [Thermodesulfovibrionales bacterium]
MRAKDFLFLAPLVPLLAVVALAVFGVAFNEWIYLLLAVVCLVTAGIILFVYKEAEKELDSARRDMKTRKN